MLVLLTACALLSLSAAADNVTICGAPPEGKRNLGNSSEMSVYELEDNTIRFRPGNDFDGKVFWEYRYGDSGNISRNSTPLVKIDLDHKKVAVKFTERTDKLQIRYVSRRDEKIKGRWVTIRLGKELVVSRANKNGSTITVADGQSVTACFVVSGTPHLLSLSVFHDGIEVNSSHYKINGSNICLEFDSFRPQDRGKYTVTANNCFNKPASNFYILVSPGTDPPSTPPSTIPSRTPSRTPSNPPSTNDSKHLPYWTYILIAGVSGVIFSVAMFLLYLKFCKKDSSNHSQLEDKESSKAQYLEGPLHLTEEPTATYPVKSNNPLSTFLEEANVQIMNPVQTENKQFAHDTTDHQPVENQYIGDGDRNPNEMGTDNNFETHELAYASTDVNALKVEHEQQPDTQYPRAEDPTCSNNLEPSGDYRFEPQFVEREEEYDRESIGDKRQPIKASRPVAYASSAVDASQIKSEQQPASDPQSLEVGNSAGIRNNEDQAGSTWCGSNKNDEPSDDEEDYENLRKRQFSGELAYASSIVDAPQARANEQWESPSLAVDCSQEIDINPGSLSSGKYESGTLGRQCDDLEDEDEYENLRKREFQFHTEEMEPFTTDLDMQTVPDEGETSPPEVYPRSKSLYHNYSHDTLEGQSSDTEDGEYYENLRIKEIGKFHSEKAEPSIEDMGEQMIHAENPDIYPRSKYVYDNYTPDMLECKSIPPAIYPKPNARANYLYKPDKPECRSNPPATYPKPSVRGKANNKPDKPESESNPPVIYPRQPMYDNYKRNSPEYQPVDEYGNADETQTTHDNPGSSYAKALPMLISLKRELERRMHSNPKSWNEQNKMPSQQVSYDGSEDMEHQSGSIYYEVPVNENNY
jgi:hypothetical protein